MMFDDIKLYGIIGILLIIIIGYFVFLLYNDLLTIKHQLKSSDSDYCTDPEDDEYVEECEDDEEFLEHHEEYADFQEHLDTIFEGIEGPETEAVVEEITEEVQTAEEIADVVEEVPLEIIEVHEPQVKKRSYKKKKSE